MDAPDLTNFLNNFGWLGQGAAWIVNILVQNLVITLIVGGVLLVIILNWKTIWGFAQREL